MSISGGCQCGAVRFMADSLGLSAICHCRMCQKAMGNVFGIFVVPHGFAWTRGEPAAFESSSLAERVFCRACGTPLGFREKGKVTEVSIGALDDPSLAPPTLEVNTEGKFPFFSDITHLPGRSPEEVARREAEKAKIVSYQHPDRDTTDWQPRTKP